MASLYRITTVISGLGGAPAYNQLYFDLASLQDGNTAAAIVGQFWGSLDAHMVNESSWTTGSEAEVVESTTGQVQTIESITPVTGVGAGVSEPVPFAAMGLIRLRTGTYNLGRELRGRVFVPYLGAGSNIGGKLSSAAVTALNDAGALLENTGCVVYSPTHRVYAAVTSASGWDQWATLRSRRD